MNILGGAGFRQTILVLFSAVALGACGGGSDSNSGSPVTPPPPPPAQVSDGFKTDANTARFLGRATFGARRSDISALSGTEVSDWVRAELTKPVTTYLPRLQQMEAGLAEGQRLPSYALTNLIFDEAIAGNDQLRQRMMLALSEIFVVSTNSSLNGRATTMGHYVDILSRNAFGNYRDLLEEITYSPAMAIYLTYLANPKGDPATGRTPDENYAREILQLMSIGLVELNIDGTPRNGGAETFDNSDITGLARVFTGLSMDSDGFFSLFRDPSAFTRSLRAFPEYHSELEKSFLGTTIAAGIGPTESIDRALDAIFEHPNVAPFISRQLIQRFVTSHPEPAYIGRVANAFETGRFVLPDGSAVGTGQRGDLGATIAAVLVDANALRDPASAPPGFGKIREPMIRFVNWARAFDVTNPNAADERLLRDAGSAGLGQHPFRSPSVFNFFRPGYIAPGSETGAAGLTAPELQITNESSVIGYINFINAFIYNFSENVSGDDQAGVYTNYAQWTALADDADALIDRIDLVLTGNNLSTNTKDRIRQLMAEIPVSTDAPDEDKFTRVLTAVSMAMTAPGYIVQK